MRVSFATEPAPGQSENEDFAGAVARAAVLLDGAGSPGGEDGGCVHVAWYTRGLGTSLLNALAQEADGTLADTLSSAIADVAASHRATCDLGHPATPLATVLILRNSTSPCTASPSPNPATTPNPAPTCRNAWTAATRSAKRSEPCAERLSDVVYRTLLHDSDLAHPHDQALAEH